MTIGTSGKVGPIGRRKRRVTRFPAKAGRGGGIYGGPCISTWTSQRLATLLPRLLLLRGR